MTPFSRLLRLAISLTMLHFTPAADAHGRDAAGVDAFPAPAAAL